MTTATASINSSTGNFMFHPRTAVFEHPITYNLPSSTPAPAPTINNKPDKNDFSQYYISEQ
jgi:hypothetical protein